MEILYESTNLNDRDKRWAPIPATRNTGSGCTFVLPHISSAFCCRSLPPLLLHFNITTKQLIRRFSIRSSLDSKSGYKGPKPKKALLVDFIYENDTVVRSLPIFVGGFSLLAVLLNRAFFGIVLVTDAARVWNSLLEATCCKSLVVVYGNKCLLQIGVAAESRGDVVPVLVQKLSQGSLYKNAMKVGKQNYLANLSLYPGRVELSFLPSNTQSVILQPIGDMGIVIIGGDTVRGFTNLDQTWISSLADKLDATLSKTLM